MRKLTVAAVFALVMLFAGRARADYGYLCVVEYFWASNSLGNNGYIMTSLYSGTNCTGSFVGSYVFPPTGSTTCTTNQLNQEAQLALMQTARSHMSTSQRTSIFAYASGAYKCATLIDFNSN